jgi:hypothetical protein
MRPASFPLPTMSPARALHVQIPEQLYIDLTTLSGGLAFVRLPLREEPDGTKTLPMAVLLPD